MVAKYADHFGVLIALEPTGNPKTVFPSYEDGIEFVKSLDLPSIRLMADLNYFIEIGEPFEDILPILGIIPQEGQTISPLNGGAYSH